MLKLPRQKWQAKNGAQNDTGKKSIREEHPSGGFLEFWDKYPGKVCRRVCEHKWKSRNLDAILDAILAGLERWKASGRWKRGYVADPLTFLNQERWKDVPPAAPADPRKPGELRVRQTTPEEDAQAKPGQEFIRLRKLNENRSKTDEELWDMVA